MLVAHVNGDHPHVLVDVHKLAVKEVHNMWPVHVDLREHEHAMWEAGVGTPKLFGGGINRQQASTRRQQMTTRWWWQAAIAARVVELGLSTRGET
jgi:hypothetical protein